MKKNILKTLCLSAASILALGASPALADPIKVESENIVFYGDTSASYAKQIVQKMEIFRKLIMTLDGVTPKPDDQKLTIYAFDTVVDLQRFADARGAAGIYTNGYDGPLMITPLRGAMDQDSFSNQVALHEYSHHILHGYRDTAYPRWYDEGFANYLSTFKIEKGTIQLGRAAAKHAQGLFPGGPKWVDIEDVISAIRVYPFADRGSKRGILLNQFYAQSWLYVHYLHSNKELSPRFGDYLDRINRGEEPLSAFEKGFGVTPEEFHKAARAYWYDNEFKIQQFKPKPEFLTVDMKANKISQAELDLQMALGQRAFLAKGTLKSYSKKLNSYEKKVGSTPLTMAARAAYYIVAEDYTQAELYAHSALAAEPESIEALRINGDLYFHKSHADAFKDLKDNELREYTLNAELAKSISYFERALQKSPDDYMSITHMVSIYGSSDIPLTTTARAASADFEALYWTSNDVNGSLNLANIHMKSGKTTEACDYFKTAKKQSDNDPNKDKSSIAARVKSMMGTFAGKCGIA